MGKEKQPKGGKEPIKRVKPDPTQPPEEPPDWVQAAAEPPYPFDTYVPQAPSETPSTPAPEPPPQKEKLLKRDPRDPFSTKSGPKTG